MSLYCMQSVIIIVFRISAVICMFFLSHLTRHMYTFSDVMVSVDFCQFLGFSSVL